jgi:hypothetical protein
MNYTIGETVIISVFKKLQVGIITDKISTKTTTKYSVRTEDTKVHDNVGVNRIDDESFINSNFTKAFNKSK